MNSQLKIPKPVNEPVLGYGPGSVEKKALKARISQLKSAADVDIPLYIGEKEIRTGTTIDCRPPHDHAKKLGRCHQGGAKEMNAAIAAALKVRKEWAATPWHVRASIFLKA